VPNIPDHGDVFDNELIIGWSFECVGSTMIAAKHYTILAQTLRKLASKLQLS
jgi:hypothetical protein